MEVGTVRENLTWPRWPEWEVESPAVISDLAALPLFALFFPLIRFCFDKLIFEKLGRRFITGYAVSSKLSADEIEANRKKLVKFKESSWKCVYYLTAEILALVVTFREPWFTSTRNFWVGPGDRRWPDQLTKVKLKGLYGFAGGFYLYSIFALLFWETRRSDFGVSMSHHVATLILIVFSYLAKLARVGSVILAVHDASDVFLEIGKLTKYSGLEVVPSISFILFAISWVILRLIIFPFVILRSTSYESLQFVDKSMAEGPIYYYVFNTLLITLQVMHIYWWILIWRMIVKQIQDRGKISDDVRSDSESDSDEDDDGKDKAD
ncbi:hypothetical protein KC19_4G124100 [Ceratodon purpureus]|uniref:TLC domain-containing protein n=1 Tax=Ceratodon purpureus TaxID=3225 RepID=A0A8T0I7Z8_CERPU|nr:hypothetical protein KC19_4G124100 [Ceratodon purpureus]